MPGFRVADVHVRRCLLEPLRDCSLPGTALANQLALDHKPTLSVVFIGPDDQQIDPAASQRVLPLNPAVATDHLVQERLQHQLRTCLRVLRPLDPVLRILPKEILKRREQLIEFEATVRFYVPYHALLWHLVHVD